MPKLQIKSIIGNVIEIDTKRGFWAKETVLLKRLVKDYPDVEFWNELVFKPKIKSFAQLMVLPLSEILRQKYVDFHLKFNEEEKVKLHTDKFGEDLVLKKKKKSLKDFLNG